MAAPPGGALSSIQTVAGATPDHPLGTSIVRWIESSVVWHGGAVHGTITYVPGVKAPSGSATPEALGVAEADRAGEGGALGGVPEPPTPFCLGKSVRPTTATTTTAAAATASFRALFISFNLHAGHQARRCEVAGSWSSTLSRTRSGSAVAPSSNHDRTMRVTSRSALIGQPPAASAWRRRR